MKRHYLLFFALSVCLLMAGCREITMLNRQTQRVIVTDFSAPVRTIQPPTNDYPVKITFRVNGTVSRAVTLTVNAISDTQPTTNLITPLVIPAGSYNDRVFSQDFYDNRRLELIITGEPGTTGSLEIEWHR